MWCWANGYRFIPVPLLVPMVLVSHPIKAAGIKLPSWVAYASVTMSKLVPIPASTVVRWVIPRSVTTSFWRSEEHTSELQSRENLVCRLLLENKNKDDDKGVLD